MPVTLVFPGGMPDSLRYMRQAMGEGRAIIGASSLTDDPARLIYTDWAILPYVTDEAFESAFLALIQSKSIDRVFTRHPIIRRYLRQLIRQHSLSLELDDSVFGEVSMQANAQAIARVQALRESNESLNLPHSQPMLTALEMAAVLRHAAHIDGQSDEDKIYALMQIYRRSPKGDVVEIGSFWGRSAFVLAWLSKKYEIGSLLCIDPWTNANAHQADVAEFVNDEAREIDFSRTFEGFLLNLIPYSAGHINYLRSPAHDAIAQYASTPFSLQSDEFGVTQHQGKIAILHIDGNHDYQHITQDIKDWTPYVLPGGWIIIDDYEWAFGDGPKRAADEWMQENEARVVSSFVKGSALFIKLRD